MQYCFNYLNICYANTTPDILGFSMNDLYRRSSTFLMPKDIYEKLEKLSIKFAKNNNKMSKSDIVCKSITMLYEREFKNESSK